MHVIVSYDGTRNDRDGLALGRLFAAAGAKVSLAYVRHSPEREPEREAEVQQESEHLLEVAAERLDGGAAGTHVIFNPSTAEGLQSLARELGADVIAFGSSYRTPPGSVGLPQTAENLIDAEAACSLAVAPAGLRREPVEHAIGSLSVYAEGEEAAAGASADALAHALGAVVSGEDADMLLVASRADAPDGRLALSSRARERIEQARCPVIALAHGAVLSFS